MEHDTCCKQHMIGSWSSSHNGKKFCISCIAHMGSDENVRQNRIQDIRVNAYRRETKRFCPLCYSSVACLSVDWCRGTLRAVTSVILWRTKGRQRKGIEGRRRRCPVVNGLMPVEWHFAYIGSVGQHRHNYDRGEKDKLHTERRRGSDSERTCQ
jgi:hypothetical protein